MPEINGQVFPTQEEAKRAWEYFLEGKSASAVQYFMECGYDQEDAEQWVWEWEHGVDTQ